MNDTSPPRQLSGLESHLGYWLRRVSNPVSGAFARALQARHVSVAEWVALRCIADRRDITPGELSDALGMTRGAVSKVIDKLEKKHWVANATDRKDSRVRRLSLTASGNRILPELADIADANDRAFFGCLTAAEQSELKRLFQKLTNVHGWSDVPVD